MSMVSNKTQAKFFSCIALGGVAYQVLNKEMGTFPLILSALSTIAATKKWYDVCQTPKSRSYKQTYQKDSPHPFDVALRRRGWKT